jgi:hypothetical protein
VALGQGVKPAPQANQSFRRHREAAARNHHAASSAR